MRRQMFKTAFLVLLAMTAPALSDEQPATMTLSGTGEIAAAPDMAMITSGVVTEAETARAALDANTAAMNALVAVMKAAGIEGRDLQTSGFAVEPRFVYPKRETQQPPRIVGYTVRNQLSVRLRELAKLGEVLDRAVTSGSNRIGDIRFAVDDTTALYDEARRAAVADALRKARILTEAAGVTLGRITNISESRTVPIAPRGAAMAMAREMSATVPVEAGELTFRVDVQITWEISP